MTHKIRLKFQLVQQLNLPGENDLHELQPLSRRATIKSNKPATPKSGQWIILEAGGYISEEMARSEAARLKNALLLLGASGLGVDLGIDKTFGHIGNVVKRQAKEQYGIIIRDDVHGLDVFEDQDVKHMSVSGSLTVAWDWPLFVARLKASTLFVGFTQRVRTAAELINDSLFDIPEEAQFILRISAIEAMCRREKRSDAVLTLIDEIAKSPVLNVNDEATLEVRNLLSDARKQSIGKTCRMRVSGALGTTASERFNILYNLRSKYLHEGSGRWDLKMPAVEALEISQGLLLAEIGAKSFDEIWTATN